jgi:hypothetical protein
MHWVALLVVEIAMTAAAALVRLFLSLFVMLFAVIDLFIAALAACLYGWLIRSARHGTADNDNGHGDDATRLRLFGGACWTALADVRLGERSLCVRV